MNGIYHTVGVTAFPVSPNPAAGTFYLGFDLNNLGHLTIQKSDGSTIDLQSGSSYSDPDAVAAVNAAILAAPSLVDPSSDDFFYVRDTVNSLFKKIKRLELLKPNADRLFFLSSDFIGTISGEFTQYIQGTGASVQNGIYGQDTLNKAIGVTQVDTGTTSTGRAGLGLVTGTILSPTLSRCIYEGRHALEALSTVTETFFFRCGLGDFYTVAGDGTNGLFFSYNDVVNGGRYTAISRAGGVTLTTIDTGITPDLDYHLFKVDLSEDGQTAMFYYDGTLVATIAAPNLPGVSQRMGCGFKIEKTLGVTQRNLSTDHMTILLERSSAR
jgi:hypothetical protein